MRRRLADKIPSTREAEFQTLASERQRDLIIQYVILRCLSHFFQKIFWDSCDRCRLRNHLSRLDDCNSCSLKNLRILVPPPPKIPWSPLPHRAVLSLQSARTLETKVSRVEMSQICDPKS